MREDSRENRQPLSVVACLAAGLETVGRHPELIFWPVLLDLWLWLGPRLSIAPLLHRLGSFITAYSSPGDEVLGAVQLLEEAGAQFNLFSLLSTLPLLNVPTLLARRAYSPVTPLGEPPVWPVESEPAFLGWVLLLLLLGTLLGVRYLAAIADRVQTAFTPGDEREMLLVGPVRLGRLIAFVVGLPAVGMGLFPLWLSMVGVLTALSPLLGLLMWAVGVWMTGYAFLQLLFVIPAILVGDLPILPAIRESVLVVRFQFPAVMGFVLLTLLIYEGLGFIWSLPPADSWTQLVGILGNGSVATGLTAAVFIFYRERRALVAALIGGTAQEQE